MLENRKTDKQLKKFNGHTDRKRQKTKEQE